MKSRVGQERRRLVEPLNRERVGGAGPQAREKSHDMYKSCTRYAPKTLNMTLKAKSGWPRIVFEAA